ncbi:MAG: Fic family protein [Anaerolineae bacterium]|nr:Fic family protein [Anaerolineae bacterium]
MLGEAQAKCEYIADAPVHPDIGAQLRNIYLAKGALATTAIEGNSLTEDQVRRILDKTLKLPPSQEYLGQQVDNVIDAFNQVGEQILSGDDQNLTPERIAGYNATILKNLPLDPEVTPGEYRSHDVWVGRYKGVPPQDCLYLTGLLCGWINQRDPNLKPPLAIGIEILKAILAHLYLAWIHPFGDGNGRVARLLEFEILLRASLPDIAVHLLSNHYNKTRDEYYRQLDFSSTSSQRGQVFPFVEYALQGFVDGLDEQIRSIQDHQLKIQWRNFVHRSFDEHTSKADTRRKHLLLDLTDQEAGRNVRPNDIPNLSPRMGAAYANKTRKTIQRDINELENMGLVIAEKGTIRANIGLLTTFLPRKRAP